MARKTVGHIELIWRCPKCGSANPGPQRFCTGCGAAQPRGVKFEQPVGAELISDENKKKEAAAGPDIHCPYGGARNPAVRVLSASGFRQPTSAMRSARSCTDSGSSLSCPEKCSRRIFTTQLDARVGYFAGFRVNQANRFHRPKGHSFFAA